MLASTIGTTIEWYDFLLYGTVTGLVFGKVFFPGSSPLIGVLQAFGVFFIGFVGRPIGAAIFGHFGDRIGRKATLIATLLIIGFATIAVGLVPLCQHRHLGRRSVDIHPSGPGHWGRRGMGRFGAARDGMGAGALLWQKFSQGYAELNHLRQCGQREGRARVM
jgi:MFS family permease